MVAQSIMALTCVYSEMTITIGDIKALVNLYGGQCTLVGERMTANNSKHALETKHRLESAIECLELERDALRELIEDKTDDRLCHCGKPPIHLSGDCS